MKTGRRSRRRGAVLLMSLFALVGLIAVSAASHVLGQRVGRSVDGRMDDRRAHQLAEAGLAEAMTAIRGGGSGNVGKPGTPAFQGQGMFWVEGTDLGGSRTRLEVVALVGSGRAALEAVVVDQGKPPLFPSVLNSRDPLTLSSSVVIDSFDSALGTYASQAVNTSNGYTYANDEGDVSSNSDIVLNSGATVFGDATPGPGASVALSNGAYVSGSTAPTAVPFSFAPITFPAIPQGGGLTVPSGGSQTIGPGDVGYTALSIAKNATLQVVGPANVLVDDFSGGKDATLSIDATNGPVTIFVRGDYAHFNGFEAVPVPGSPMAMAFLIDGSAPITFPSASRVRGAYYAPNAAVTFTSGNEAWGSFAGRQVSMSANTRFHYDETLAQHWEADSGPADDTMDVEYWGSAEVPKNLRLDRRDPFLLLGVQANALPSPSQAWDLP